MVRADPVFAWYHSRLLEGKLVEDPTARTEAKKLYEDFITWCEENEIPKEEGPTQSQFTLRLKAYWKKTTTHACTTIFIGLKLKT